MRYLVFSFVCVLGCAGAPDTPTADPSSDAMNTDAATASDLGALGSDAVTTVLENARVHVHRVALAAGASLPAHDGGERIVYALTDLPALTFEAGGTSEARSFLAGEVRYHEAGVHAVANESDAPAEFVVFERRSGTVAAADFPPEPAGAEGVTDEVLFDSDFATVRLVTLEPGASSPSQRNHARAFYVLAGDTVTFTVPDGSQMERFQAGQAHYREPGDFRTEIAGDAGAEFLVVAFKR
ncbi:MAG: hypothetical protein AAF809_03000 [Bacteroidota bacterium]